MDPGFYLPGPFLGTRLWDISQLVSVEHRWNNRAQEMKWNLMYLLGSSKGNQACILFVIISLISSIMWLSHHWLWSAAHMMWVWVSPLVLDLGEQAQGIRSNVWCFSFVPRPVPGSLSSLLHLHNRQRQPMPASMPGTLPNPTMPGSSAVLMPVRDCVSPIEASPKCRGLGLLKEGRRSCDLTWLGSRLQLLSEEPKLCVSLPQRHSHSSPGILLALLSFGTLLGNRIHLPANDQWTCNSHGVEFAQRDDVF